MQIINEWLANAPIRARVEMPRALYHISHEIAASAAPDSQCHDELRWIKSSNTESAGPASPHKPLQASNCESARLLPTHPAQIAGAKYALKCHARRRYSPCNAE